MQIKELTEEQIQTMTLEQKDEWWLKNVYRGDMPQLNLRSGITGMLLGGILSLTNLYVGIKTGWALGVGITSVILSFSAFKVFSKLKIGPEMSILENNAMQSVATSAGYMTVPLVSAIPAYMLVTGTVIPFWHTMVWIILLALLGVLFAFPLKKRFINDEQMPFPEGYAAAVVLTNLHSDEGEKEGTFKAKILGFSALISALVETARSEGVMDGIKLSFLKIPEHWDDFLYRFWTPTILGTPLKDLTVQLESSFVMVATGGLMGLRVGYSMLLGAATNYLILAPILIQDGIIQGTGFKKITMWSLWCGAAMMTTGSLYAFFSKSGTLITTLKKFFSKTDSSKVDILKDIEVPSRVFIIGLPIVSILVIYFGHLFFNIAYLHGLIAIPLIFIFTLIAVMSTGLTSVTPGNVLSKLTQLTFAVIAPNNIGTNISTAGIAGEAAANASNLLSDIKPGYMLGAKPRHQVVGHVLGIFAGALAAVPVYYLIFHNDISLLTSEKLPMPAAMVWRAVAEVLNKGLDALHPTVKIAVAIGAALGFLFEYLNRKMNGKFPISSLGFGLAFVLRFTDSLAMGLGAVLFWYFEKKLRNPEATAYKILVANRETVCAGIIAGGSIIGIILILLETVVFSQ